MIKFITGAMQRKQWPDSDCEILLVGRSNVGKSTFLNNLAKQRIAYVGKTPGKTRMLNFFADEQYTLVDAPGYGYAKRSTREIDEYRQMMEEYFNYRDALRLVVLLVDARHKPSVEDQEMMEFLRQQRLPILVVATKVDKLRRNDYKLNAQLIADTLCIPVDSVFFKDLSNELEVNKLHKEIIHRLSIL